MYWGICANILTPLHMSLKEVAGIFFRQKFMRRHLVKCQGKMSPFPRDKYKPKLLHSRKPKKIGLYCRCLMPETWGDMVA